MVISDVLILVAEITMITSSKDNMILKVLCIGLVSSSGIINFMAYLKSQNHSHNL